MHTCTHTQAHTSHTQQLLLHHPLLLFFSYITYFCFSHICEKLRSRTVPYSSQKEFTISLLNEWMDGWVDRWIDEWFLGDGSSPAHIPGWQVKGCS